MKWLKFHANPKMFLFHNLPSTAPSPLPKVNLKATNHAMSNIQIEKRRIEINLHDNDKYHYLGSSTSFDFSLEYQLVILLNKYLFLQ